MTDIVEVKKLLKQWEVIFWKEHNRKPNKYDIDAAPTDIKETYLKYTKLKKGNGEATKSPEENHLSNESSSHHEDTENVTGQLASRDGAEKREKKLDKVDTEDGIKDDDEVWGKQFDRKLVKTDDPAVLKDVKADNRPAFLKNLGKKMFEQSLKLNRLQPGLKSDSKPWRKPDTPRPVKPMYVDGDQDECLGVSNPKVNDDNVADAKKSDTSTEEKAENFGKLFEKAASMSKHKVTTSGDVDTSVYLSKFQTKSKPKQSILPCKLSSLVKKYKAELDIHDEDYDTELTESIDNANFKENSDEGDDESAMSSGHSWNVPVSKLIRDDENENCRKPKNINKIQTDKKAKNKPSIINKNAKECETPSFTVHAGHNNWSKFDSKNGAEDELTTRESKREISRDNREQEEWESEGRSSKQTEQEMTRMDDKFEFNEDSENEVPVKRKTKRAMNSSKMRSRGRKPKRKLEEDDEEVDHVSGDIKDENSEIDSDEIASPKNNKKTAKTQPPAKKRKTSPKKQVADGDGIVGDDSVPASVPARKPPRAKPVSNDNFIKLNMKIKTYKRKGRHMTGPQYKRKMWKEKMQARSKSYGDACFKCGQSGHWANKCPGTQSKSHYDKEPVLEEDFPSMQEAAMMARGLTSKNKKTSNVSKKPDSESEVPEAAAAAGSIDVPMEDDDIDLEIQSGIVRSRPESAAPPQAMKPLIECGEGEALPATPEFVLKGLRKFGFEKFRPGQEDAVMRILCGLSTLVVLSTGGGKSLCYQLPAYLYAERSPCITLVISPLVSLMEDQVTGLPHGIRGMCLHTNMTANQRESVLEAVKSGKVHFLLVSPEAIAGGTMSLVSSMSSLPPVAFVCIDEAHCLSEWSHNFRPSYLRLCKVLQEKLGVRCFLGLTATATLSTASDVARHLRISDFRKATVRGSPIPANLILSVSRDEDKDQALIGLLKGARFGNLASIIVYCTRRDQTEKVATIIRTCMNTGGPTEKVVSTGRGKSRPKLEWDAESYHAGMSAAQRKRVQNAFMSGKLRVVVATVAFGMGLDKSDVRGIIHYNMPKSFESYVQEIGRAGRDGQQSECHVFLNPEGKDLCELRRHTYSNTVDYRTLKKLVQKVFPSCRCRDVHERHTQAVLEAQMFDDDFDEVDSCNSQVPSSSAGQSQKNIVTMETSQPGSLCKQTRARVCPGHERALSIQQTVMDVDVKEEGISTLLCYLELHDCQWLENMSNVYASCRVQCYGGPNQLQAVAKKCPPVAVAIAQAKKEGKSFSDKNCIEFSVVEVSDTMGWDSGPVKKELKLLQWNFDSGGPKRTGVMVEFSDLAYHFRTPGDFTTEELDDILQFLHERVQRQEKSEIHNLSRLNQALWSVSHKNNWMCSEEADMSKNDKLKEILNQYFDQQGNVADVGEHLTEHIEEPISEFAQGQLVSDIRAFYNLYGQEHSLNGRAVARIFHGISSPCFPATTWGRVRRFWRSHLDIDFNVLMKIATRELVSFR